MSHAYPLAPDAAAALTQAREAARTRSEAEVLANGETIVALQTDWVNLATDALEATLATANAGPGHGFVQVYEDMEGHPTLAVTYWKLIAETDRSVPPPVPDTGPAAEDETDDLYFKHKGSSGRKKAPDPNQLELFSPDPARSVTPPPE